ncbi:AraC family transcriptional regulator [Kribbella sandramycini]|uniref:AraC family cel operon transcriptional repressor n=1 Tax=Kribbella sandramycini TaxID=60450 RepID=A0A7Y4KXX5_9ACTN|nr:AraC family cel operon transcriptional repressor [Kribbella sandramycini]NOL40675.1 AraC family transcriptional regulator [Kribbella sandramycini]
MIQLLRFESHALGRPYHAARVRIPARSGDTELHTHADFHEFMGVVSGTGEHLLSTGSESLVRGDVVLVRPADQHAIRGAGLEFINIAFPSSAWQGFLDLTRSACPARFHAERALPAFEHALDRFQNAPTTYDLLRFWIDLLQPVAPEAAPRDVPGWLGTACTAMRSEANLRAGLPRLLELAAVSPAHLSRSMRAAYGRTPTDFVTDLRLEHAASLLAATNLPIAAVADRCGFSSQSYFSRRFTIAHELSPREFRRTSQRAFVP